MIKIFLVGVGGIGNTGEAFIKYEMKLRTNMSSGGVIHQSDCAGMVHGMANVNAVPASGFPLGATFSVL